MLDSEATRTMKQIRKIESGFRLMLTLWILETAG